MAFVDYIAAAAAAAAIDPALLHYNLSNQLVPFSRRVIAFYPIIPLEEFPVALPDVFVCSPRKEL